MTALSSGEAELYAVVKASCEGLGIRAYGLDLGMSLHGNVYTDSSAALGILDRTGLGRTNHLHTQALWIQEVERLRRLTFAKVRGEQNPADLMAKYLCRLLVNRHSDFLNAQFADGRASSAPSLNSFEPNHVLIPQELLQHIDAHEAKDVSMMMGDYAGMPRAAANEHGSERGSYGPGGGELHTSRDDCL